MKTFVYYSRKTRQEILKDGLQCAVGVTVDFIRSEEIEIRNPQSDDLVGFFFFDRAKGLGPDNGFQVHFKPADRIFKRVYLATPYSHPNELVVEDRYHAAVQATKDLMIQFPGHRVFSPIVHSHPLHMAEGLPKIPGKWEFWSAQDFSYLGDSDELWVLRIDGFQISKGVQAEVDFAVTHDIPVRYVDVPQEGSSAYTIA